MRGSTLVETSRQVESCIASKLKTRFLLDRHRLALVGDGLEFQVWDLSMPAAVLLAEGDLRAATGRPNAAGLHGSEWIEAVSDSQVAVANCSENCLVLVDLAAGAAQRRHGFALRPKAGPKTDCYLRADRYRGVLYAVFYDSDTHALELFLLSLRHGAAAKAECIYRGTFQSLGLVLLRRGCLLLASQGFGSLSREILAFWDRSPVRLLLALEAADVLLDLHVVRGSETREVIVEAESINEEPTIRSETVETNHLLALLNNNQRKEVGLLRFHFNLDSITQQQLVSATLGSRDKATFRPLFQRDSTGAVSDFLLGETLLLDDESRLLVQSWRSTSLFSLDSETPADNSPLKLLSALPYNYSAETLIASKSKDVIGLTAKPASWSPNLLRIKTVCLADERVVYFWMMHQVGLLIKLPDHAALEAIDMLL